MSLNILVKSFGCSANMSDGEAIKGMLKNAEFRIVDENAEEIAMIILNVCTVKGDDNALTEIKKTLEKRPHCFLIVAGCVPKKLAKEIKKIKENATILGTHNLREIVSAVEETIHNNPQVLLEQKRKPKVLLHKIRDNPIIGIIPISNGCLGKCAYCSVRLIKGKLYSYPEDLIIKEAENCIKQGCKELWITAQDTACYGKDTGTNITELLKKILALEGDFYVRLGMGTPQHIKENIDELIEIFKHQKMFKFLHIPVQSGSNPVLRAMKREYTIDEFNEIIKKIRTAIPDITIATDIIAGFPGETEKQFYDTILFLQNLKPDVLNISKFVARTDTPAANKKDQIPGAEIKQRSKKITDTFDFIGFEQNIKWKNWVGEVLIDEHGKEGTMKARNFAYKPIIVKGKYPPGKKITVRIAKVTKHDLRGERILKLKE
ncbi:tRNA (N(6)-L-threonylcarbamoyladenosine(37)-C(2))-methylthiotransferase [Candidatus Woesearchaeota archaeon]|nr:tRNA (N(6)-L-threonylcarbamoyladenosine(37)-C(2))-methylthiotransferase [Candidatus Woesearchaeota archaeon]